VTAPTGVILKNHLAFTPQLFLNFINKKQLSGHFIRCRSLSPTGSAGSSVSQATDQQRDPFAVLKLLIAG